MGFFDRLRRSGSRRHEDGSSQGSGVRRRRRGLDGERAEDSVADFEDENHEMGREEDGSEREGEEEDGEEDASERPLLVVSEDADHHLLSVEGEGVVNIVERRGDILLGNLTGFISGIFMSLPCCIVWKTTFRKQDEPREGATQSSHTTRTEHQRRGEEFTDSTAVQQAIWPVGFGPGWFIRTFCPLILLFWCLVLYNGIMFGPDLFQHLNAQIDPPDGSPSALFLDEFKKYFFHVAREDFPAQTVLMIERIDGSSVLTEEVEIFCKVLQTALICREEKKPGQNPTLHCEGGANNVMPTYSYSGYYTYDDPEEREIIKPAFVNNDESATFVYIKHRISLPLGKEYFDYLDAFIDSNKPNPELYRVRFTNEQKLLFIAQDEVIYDFEHADLIGIPFAWVILLWYCGFPALLVLISLPVCLLSAFSMSVYWMPQNLQLPTFAPSMIVSMGVALNVDYALFMLVRYSEEIKRGASRNFALDKAMSTAGKTIAVSGSIMLFSNGCLYFVKANTVSSLGVALAITNLLTIVTNITLLPALLCLFGSLFDHLRDLPIPTVYGSILKACQILSTPLRWLFQKVFGSGRKRKAFKILQQSESATNFETLSTERHLLIEDSDSLTGESTPNTTPNLPTSDVETLFGESAVRRSHEYEHHLSESLFDDEEDDEEIDHLSNSNGEFGVESSVHQGSAHSQERLLTTKRKNRVTRSHSSKFLSAQSRVWAAIANLCLRYPRALCGVVLSISIPICVQIAHFDYTDSQANLVPSKSAYVVTFDDIGSNGFAQGWMADYKAIFAGPDNPNAKLPLTKDQCFDDDSALEKAVELLELDIDVPSISCTAVVNKIGHCGGFSNSSKALTILSGLLKNYCAYSCDTCRIELYTSRDFYRGAIEAYQLVLDSMMEFATANEEKAGGHSRLELSLMESVTYFMGRRFDWEKVRSLLSAAHRNPESEDTLDRMFRDRFHNMTGWNATHTVARLRTPFHPYNDLPHKWVNKIHRDANEARFNDLHFRFFFGGAAVQLFDQVDEVFKDTPPVMLAAVVLTVLGMSVIVFQSILLGPRLLLTVALTICLVFGCTVLIFQDWHQSPNSSGLYWIVPILGVPIMVGCTLDYDSFVVARIYEMRLASLSTEAAVFAGLQETGHVITIAGVIMTVAFGSMIASAIPVIQQIGTLLVACCILDTFIVRSLLVPSLMLIAVDWNWYPKKMPEVLVTMETLREAAAIEKVREAGKTRVDVVIDTHVTAQELTNSSTTTTVGGNLEERDSLSGKLTEPLTHQVPSRSGHQHASSRSQEGSPFPRSKSNGSWASLSGGEDAD